MFVLKCSTPLSCSQSHHQVTTACSGPERRHGFLTEPIPDRGRTRSKPSEERCIKMSHQLRQSSVLLWLCWGKCPTASSGMRFQHPSSWSSAHTPLGWGREGVLTQPPKGLPAQRSVWQVSAGKQPVTPVDCCQLAHKPGLSSPEKFGGDTCFRI